MPSTEESIEALAYDPLRTNQKRRYFFKALRENRLYITSDIYTLPQGGTINLHLKNPAGSGVTMIVSNIEVGSFKQAKGKIYDTFSTAPSGGTDVNFENNLLDKANGDDGPEHVVGATDVSFTASDGTHAATLIGGGTGGSGVGGTNSVIETAVEPGREIVIEVEETSNNETEGEITATFVEANEVFSEQDVFTPN